MRAIHDFDDCKRRSESEQDNAMWEAAFARAFPGHVGVSKTAGGNTQAQRLGIDFVVTLSSGQLIRIDAKARPGRMTRDVALEVQHVHDDGRVTPGWVEKDLQIDYLAYGLPALDLVYVIPWPMLRRAWLHYRSVWVDQAKARSGGFFWAQARNRSYVSCSACIPEAVLLKAVQVASVIDLTKPPLNPQQLSLLDATA